MIIVDGGYLGEPERALKEPYDPEYPCSQFFMFFNREFKAGRLKQRVVLVPYVAPKANAGLWISYS